MELMNSRGQGFDVFKLLIAAVVAMSILVILFQLLNTIPGFTNTDPGDKAGDMVKSQITKPSSPALQKNVTFNQGTSLNAKTIAAKSDALSTDQVCVLNSNKISSAATKFTTNGTILLYKGTSPQKTGLMVLCDRGKTELDDTLGAYGYPAQYGFQTSGCSTAFNNNTSETVCVVVVVPDA